ncbi:MAG: hypothetical protein MHPSP_000731, partial [Paramarteilia canceri]
MNSEFSINNINKLLGLFISIVESRYSSDISEKESLDLKAQNIEIIDNIINELEELATNIESYLIQEKQKSSQPSNKIESTKKKKDSNSEGKNKSKSSKNKIKSKKEEKIEVSKSDEDACKTGSENNDNWQHEIESLIRKEIKDEI